MVSLVHPRSREHIALIYDDIDEMNRRIAEYINEGLKRKQLCVYATIHYRDEDHIHNFASLIVDYDENVKNENLLIVDLAPLYISAMLGDMKPFEDAKRLFTERARNKTDKHIRFVGDATGFLFRNKHFNECATLERWWQEKPFEGSYVCPFPSHDKNYSQIHANHAIVNTHDYVVDISRNRETLSQEEFFNDNVKNGDDDIE